MFSCTAHVDYNTNAIVIYFSIKMIMLNDVMTNYLHELRGVWLFSCHHRLLDSFIFIKQADDLYRFSFTSSSGT